MAADMVADMEVDMVADMAANKKKDRGRDWVDKVADTVKCIGSKLFDANCTRHVCLLSFASLFIVVHLTFCHSKPVLPPELPTLTHDADVLVSDQDNIQSLSARLGSSTQHHSVL